MRVKGGVVSTRRHKRMLKLAKGFKGRRRSCFKLAKRSVQKALTYAYKDRKIKKRDFRSLWIVRINAACRENGLSYSRFISGLKKANIGLDRRSLAHIAMHDPKAFAAVSEQVRAALAA